MCGIVGHLGKNSVDSVLEGLKRLEYRGYDSAGVCFKNKNGLLELHKKTGKLRNLKLELEKIDIESNSCIGHTRWATHGEVNDMNAHPHLSDSIAVDNDHSIAIVHNGIIENINELKDKILKKGLKFTTKTDSEVFLGLMVMYLNESSTFSEEKFINAVIYSFKQIEGNSAFVIQIKGSNKIIAIKRGAPLVCGKRVSDYSSDILVSSDPYALAGMVDEMFFPEDEILCLLTPTDEKQSGTLEFFELNGDKSTRVLKKKQSKNFQVAEKGGFEHFMLKEIHEQPILIRKLYDFYINGDGPSLLKKFSEEQSPKRIYIIGCGTAWHAGLVIKNVIEQNNKIPCYCELASEFRYRNPLFQKGDLGVFISQSGETADTLASQELCKQAGIKTLAFVNVEESTLYRNSDYNLLINAGVEIGVASTKAFTMQVLTGIVYSLALHGKVDSNSLKVLGVLAQKIDDLLLNTSAIRSIAEEIYKYNGFIFTGRGVDYPIAFEGALKLKEIAYVHAEGYAAGELKHGPIALIDEQMVNIALVNPTLYDKTVSNIHEVKARKGKIVIIGPKGDNDLIALADHYIPLDFKELNTTFSPIYANVANQLLSYYMAKFKGTDIDKPRNLAKSVTVE